MEAFFCISNVNIVEILEKKTGIPVTVENDAKCAALAEIWQGSLKDCQNAIVVVCGTAVGGAVIVNREVVSGKKFHGREFSYVITDSKDDYKMSNSLAETAGAQALLKSVSEETGIPVEELNGEKRSPLRTREMKKLWQESGIIKKTGHPYPQLSVHV